MTTFWSFENDMNEALPNGFGSKHGIEIYDINVNHRTKNTHGNPLGTPTHIIVPCLEDAVCFKEKVC